MSRSDFTVLQYEAYCADENYADVATLTLHLTNSVMSSGSSLVLQNRAGNSSFFQFHSLCLQIRFQVISSLFSSHNCKAICVWMHRTGHWPDWYISTKASKTFGGGFVKKNTTPRRNLLNKCAFKEHPITLKKIWFWCQK